MSMGDLPEISVIVPVYNAKRYIEQCMGSILHQNFKDFEVVLVDDVSTDGTFDLLNSLYGSLDNVRILRHERNLGQGAARNTGLWAARGRYVTFVDDDDVLLPNALSLLHDVAAGTGAAVVASNTHLRSTEEGGSVIGPQSEFRVYMPFSEDYRKEKVQMLSRLPERKQEVLRIYQTNSIWMTVWGNLYEREFLVSHRIFFPDRRIWAEDMLFLLPCLIKADLFAVMTDPFYVYRVHGASDSNQSKSPEYLGYLADSEMDGLRYLDRYAEDEFFRNAPGLHESIKEAFVMRVLMDKSRHFFAEGAAFGSERDRAVQQLLEKHLGEDAFFAKVHFYLANIFYAKAMEFQEENERLKEQGKHGSSGTGGGNRTRNGRMEIYPDTKVYIVCPGNYHTGGVELLHQLCSCLLMLDVDAYMLYIPRSDDFNPDNPVDPFYEKYHIQYAKNVVDEEHNIVVVNEVSTDFLYKFQKARRILWWLSVDNFLSNRLVYFYNMFLSPLGVPMEKFFLFGGGDEDVVHWAQSEYARQFLGLNGIPAARICLVEDYINQAFLDSGRDAEQLQKEDMVVFNPQKGERFTKALAEIAPDMPWVPLQGMTPEGVRETLRKAKVYIDFGNHPGKDRIPREAAVSGCVVITGKRGSAANDIDINIPQEFKFDEGDGQRESIAEKIREIFRDYPAEYAKQERYRARIREERQRFQSEVADAFGIENPLERRWTAVIESGDGTASRVAELLAQKAEERLVPIFVVDDGACPGGGDRKHISLSNGQRAEVISSEDGRFLYREGRIRYFAVSHREDKAVADTLKKLQVPEEQLITVKC